MQARFLAILEIKDLELAPRVLYEGNSRGSTMGVVMSFAVDGHARNSRATAYYKILSRPPSGVSSNGRLGSQAVEDLIRTGISQGRSGAGSNEKRRPSALSSIIDRYCARLGGAGTSSRDTAGWDTPPGIMAAASSTMPAKSNVSAT